MLIVESFSASLYHIWSKYFVHLTAFSVESMLVADIRCIPFSTQLFKLKTKIGIHIFTIIEITKQATKNELQINNKHESSSISLLLWLFLFSIDLN